MKGTIILEVCMMGAALLVDVFEGMSPHPRLRVMFWCTACSAAALVLQRVRFRIRNRIDE